MAALTTTLYLLLAALSFETAHGLRDSAFHSAQPIANYERQPLGSLERYQIWPTLQIPDPQPPDSSSGNWLGWGADLYNNRWAASDAIVSSKNLRNLTLTCQKQYSPGVSANPYVADGIAYFPTWSGLFIALDYSNCRVLWQTNISKIIYDFKQPETDAAKLVPHVSRTTPAINGGTIYIGTQLNALIVALDKQTGRLIDTFQLSTNPYAIVTMSPTFYDGKLYVGTSSDEETVADLIPGYVCCDFIGTMNALELRNGRLALIWTQNMIPPGSNFSGVAVWGSQPAIDVVRNQVFVATGNVYSIPPEYQQCQDQTANITVIKQGNTTDPCTPRNVYQEAVIAFDLNTGFINWANQLSPLDAWNLACFPGFPSANPGGCGTPTPGPDADFGIAPTFVPGSYATPNGLDIVVVGQKNGNLYALTAQAGRVLWTTTTSPDSALGGLIWGIAVDDTAVYFTGTNALRQPWKLPNGTTISNSLFGAVSLLDGRILWETASPRNSSSYVPPTVVNDLVLTGTTGSYSNASFFPVPPGSFIALNKRTGEIVRETKLDGWFQGGISVVHDRAMFGTGYLNVQGGYNGSFQVYTLPAVEDARLEI